MLEAPTNVAIVDWYWSVATELIDPYSSFVVACFEPGRVMVASAPS